MSLTKTLFLSLLFGSLYVLAQEEPYVDPKDDPRTVTLKYIPNKPVAVAFGILYLAVAGGWSVFYAVGLFLRLAFAADTHNLGMFICMNTIVVLSPCAFIATVYMLLGRLALHLDADEYLLVKARIITKLFLTSDIITLLIQATGGAMVTNQDLSEIVGLIIQLISFIFYMAVYAVFIYRMMVNRPEECFFPRNKAGFFTHWTALAGSLTVSCIGILIRSVFRTIEHSQGYGGHLATTESYFYVLDALPLFIGIL
ncbi:RTA1-like protein [Rhizoctonia solani]|uniref:RTA1-like protein n=1 Tax=Rhizoctonia solani TaxID=456999 RepID=A0A8H8NYA0_9AGAM|nr:RTA1-like protein [Rhizoctonia solani]QRW20977.1 RTA1-like protein [Rhizoctonia solani]